MTVFGEPYEASDGTVVITVTHQGWFDRGPRPVGAYTVTAQGTTWTPATDSSRRELLEARTGFVAALLGVSTGFVAALLATAAILRRPPWPELTERVMIARSQARGSR